MARLGEALAGRFLIERGAKIVDRNVRSGRGEIDILARFPHRLVAVEVKTRVGLHDPRLSFTDEKAGHVRTAASGLRPRPSRIDLVAISLTSTGADIRWIAGV